MSVGPHRGSDPGSTVDSSHGFARGTEGQMENQVTSTGVSASEALRRKIWETPMIEDASIETATAKSHAFGEDDVNSKTGS
jgi:hypothetical protein